MGMPVITHSDITREQAITDLIQSVALQETALAHILNAEGEKMQKFINKEYVDNDDLLELNESVSRMVSNVTRLEVILQSKLELFTDEDLA